jgi:hypothetical protein
MEMLTVVVMRMVMVAVDDDSSDEKGCIAFSWKASSCFRLSTSASFVCFLTSSPSTKNSISKRRMSTRSSSEGGKGTGAGVDKDDFSDDGSTIPSGLAYKYAPLYTMMLALTTTTASHQDWTLDTKGRTAPGIWKRDKSYGREKT